MKIKLLSSALDDLSEGWLFYEKQGEEGWESSSLILYFPILIL